MGGYAVFLAPIAGIIASDYWVIKRRQIDVPALYDPYGRYRYWYGINWQALLAFLLAVGPNLPGLAYSINASGTHISAGAKNLYTFDWLYGFVTSIFVYVTLHKIFPARESLIPKTIDGVEVAAERKGEPGSDTPRELSDDEKHIGHVHENRRLSEGIGYANVDPLHHAHDVWDKN